MAALMWTREWRSRAARGPHSLREPTMEPLLDRPTSSVPHASRSKHAYEAPAASRRSWARFAVVRSAPVLRVERHRPFVS